MDDDPGSRYKKNTIFVTWTVGLPFIQLLSE